MKIYVCFKLKKKEHHDIAAETKKNNEFLVLKKN